MTGNDNILISSIGGDKYLLPAGLEDALPPQAEFEAYVTSQILVDFKSYGYDRIDPPLLEFEECLLNGSSADSNVSKQTFRMMDPVSRKMLGVRVDMTIQAARIASSRLAGEPRPLRLSYAGKVLRVMGTQLRPSRQFTQAGIELIGTDCAAADAEVIVLSVHALEEIGVKGICIDLNIPQLASLILHEQIVSGQVDLQIVKGLLEAKAPEIVSYLKGNGASTQAEIIKNLIDAAGEADSAILKLQSIEFSGEAASIINRLIEVVNIVKSKKANLTITVDVVENVGLGYHKGITFNLYAKGSSLIIGRGGRYITGTLNADKNKEETGGEDAVGATLFLDSIMPMLSMPQDSMRVLVAENANQTKAEQLRKEGIITINAMEIESKDIKLEAKRMKCSHVLLEDELLSVI